MSITRKISIYNDIRVEISGFDVDGGVSEYHAMLHVIQTNKPFREQLEDIHSAFSHLLSEFGENVKPVFRRYFLTDAANQSKFLESILKDYPSCATSAIQQPPLDGSKIALWVYFLSDVEIKKLNKGIIAEHNAYRHIWTAGRQVAQPDSYAQTEWLLQEYVDGLKKEECSLENNCVRTWFFVQNIDVNYNGLVQARKIFFEKHHLNNHSHYIASTGIEGRSADSNIYVIFDAYAIKGLQGGQQKFLYAPTHLSPTYEYGVTFERGVCIEYGDRRHVIISGTASIDNRGTIVAPDDVIGQAYRMLENVEALLSEAETSFDDVMQIIIYLRDIADYSTVSAFFKERFETIPQVIVLAPVCRTGWLIEIECIAVKKNRNMRFAIF
jgi:enamine deaminase RidA (YjgF/YER057c/UK114 family)